jgi:hypothetical protein
MSVCYVAASPPGFLACENRVSRVTHVTDAYMWLSGLTTVCAGCFLAHGDEMLARWDGGCEDWRQGIFLGEMERGWE